MKGIAVGNVFDKLAVSVDSFGSLDLFLNNSLTDNSRVLVHRNIQDRITSIAPFLHVDGDPYVVADTSTGHLDYVADAYVADRPLPRVRRCRTASSYMRNAVKAVVDARTCAVTLYAVDLNEPITAAWNAIYPGLLQPLDSMSAALRSHLRYPEDLFTAQAQVYANVHVSSASVFFNGSDRYRIAQQQINGQQQDTQPYYVEMTLPGDSQPSFNLFQAFSPASSSGGGANNMTALAGGAVRLHHDQPSQAGGGAAQQLGQRARAAAVRQQHQHRPGDQPGDQPAQPARFVGHPRQRHRAARSTTTPSSTCARSTCSRPAARAAPRSRSCTR